MIGGRVKYAIAYAGSKIGLGSQNGHLVWGPKRVCGQEPCHLRRHLGDHQCFGWFKYG